MMIRRSRLSWVEKADTQRLPGFVCYAHRPRHSNARSTLGLACLGRRFLVYFMSFAAVADFPVKLSFFLRGAEADVFAYRASPMPIEGFSVI